MPIVETEPGPVFYSYHDHNHKGPTAAPPFVLIHGAGGSRLNWPAEIRRFPEAAVYTLDLPGHGRAGGTGCTTVAAYGDALRSFLAAIGAPPAVLIGHSMGGAIAMTVALEAPERVAALVLVATGARLRVAPAILEGIRNDFAQAAALINQLAWATDTSPALVRQGERAFLQNSPQVVWGDFTACDHFDVRERLGEIAVPTLIIGGTDDRLTPLKYAQYLEAHIPTARLEVVEGAGHMVALERPVEVAKMIRAHLPWLSGGRIL